MPRVQDGYASAGTGGHARPLRKRPNRLISGENVSLARALAWTRVPYPSFPVMIGLKTDDSSVAANGLLRKRAQTPSRALPASAAANRFRPHECWDCAKQ